MLAVRTKYSQVLDETGFTIGLGGDVHKYYIWPIVSEMKLLLEL